MRARRAPGDKTAAPPTHALGLPHVSCACGCAWWFSAPPTGLSHVSCACGCAWWFSAPPTGLSHVSCACGCAWWFSAPPTGLSHVSCACGCAWCRPLALKPKQTLEKPCTGDAASDEGGAARHQHLLAELALGLLLRALRRGPLAGRSPAVLARLDPLLPLLVRALRSRHAAVAQAALRALALLVPLPLPGAPPARRGCAGRHSGGRPACPRRMRSARARWAAAPQAAQCGERPLPQPDPLAQTCRPARPRHSHGRGAPGVG